MPDAGGRPRRRNRGAEHVSLLAQRERESEAHAEYLRARKRLLRRARLSRRAFAGCCDIATVAANS